MVIIVILVSTISVFARSTVILIALNLSAHATTFYVDGSGNDSNPGTQALPFQTIQKAIDTVNSGDNVLVSAGF
jgi:hypothetical protein